MKKWSLWIILFMILSGMPFSHGQAKGTPTPIPLITPTPAATATPTATSTAVPSPTVLPSPTLTVTSTVVPSPTVLPSPTPTPASAPALLSPVSVIVHDQRPWFTWTDTGDPGYTIEMEGVASSFAFWAPRSDACHGGICTWQSPVYLGPGPWTWRITGASTSTAAFTVRGNTLEGSTLVERRIDYGDLVTAAGVTILATMAVVWMMFDIVQRTLLRRMRQ